MTKTNPLLAGVRVLDLSRLLPGPYCTMLLADMGAEVIKVETPGVGDYARLIPEHLGGDATFMAVNRNKKSLALNYRSARGLPIFLRLARDADVVVETFRPGAVDRWGLGYQAVSAENPRVVYCSLSGYGQTGPYAERPGHDLNYLALGGLLALNRPAGEAPIPPSAQIADLAGGMLAAIAILGALIGRQHTGRGTYLDVSMLDATVSWAGTMAGALFLHSGKNPEPGQTPLTGGLPCYNVYGAADGKFLALSALEPPFWTAFCTGLSRDDLISRQFDPALIPELAAIFRTQTRAEWLERFQGAEACLEPVYEVDEMVQDPQVRHRGLVVGSDPPAGAADRPALRFGPPFQLGSNLPASPPPVLGQHTREILARAGLSDEEIRELERAKVVRHR
jgi:crotonobetainyl-CoA:carnitine CoA-transferase CaiB-like acyl-CoA transferase